MLAVNFDINNIFTKLEQDQDLLTSLIPFNVFLNEEYKKITTDRITHIYDRDFNLYSYWMGESTFKGAKIRLKSIDWNLFQLVSDLTFRIKIMFNAEIHEEEYFSIDFNGITSNQQVVDVLNNKITFSNDIFLKEHLYFEIKNNYLYVVCAEVYNNSYPIELTISNSTFAGTQFLSFINFPIEVTKTGNDFSIPFYTNSELTDCTVIIDNVVTQLTNNQLIDYVFQLSTVTNTNVLVNSRNRFLYHYKYMGIDWFFYKNWNYFVPGYDRDIINSKPQLKLFYDAITIKLDKLAEAVQDLNKFTDVDIIPEHLLDQYAALFNYYKEDYTVNTLSFREIIKNIISIYKIKGNYYSVELFFKFIGYDVTIKEYFFDRREIFNPSKNPLTGSELKTDSKFYLSDNRPTFINTKYSGGIFGNLTFLNDSFNLIEEREITETKNLFDFDRICKNQSNDFIMNKLGFDADGAMFNHGFTYNREKAELGAPKAPYLNKETFTAKDLLAMDKEPGDVRWHQNDFPLFHKLEGIQEIKYNREKVYIKDKVTKTADDFTYFKTNFITIEIKPFKTALSPIDDIILNKYINTLIPIFVNKYIIVNPGLVSLNVPFVIDDVNELKYTVIDYGHTWALPNDYNDEFIYGDNTVNIPLEPHIDYNSLP